MSKVLICGRGGCGKSTLTTLLAKTLQEKGNVLVIDSDESNLGLGKMLGQKTPPTALMDSLGGKSEVAKKLIASLKGENTEQANYFSENLSLNDLPDECVNWEGSLGNMRIGKIEHSEEGCACPMGSVSQSLLKKLQVNTDEWVIVDTEAGVEHFGRGVLKGTDVILMVVDTSHESVLLAEKAKQLSEEAGKSFYAVLNKVDENTEPVLRQELADRGVEIAGVLNNSTEINQANLLGNELDKSIVKDNIYAIINKAGV